MAGYRPGRYVLFPFGGGERIGTIERAETIGGADGYLVNGFGTKPGSWLVFAGDIFPIPDGAPILTEGQHVQVAVDAPHYAGRVGTVEEPQVRDRMFGYWLRLSRTGQPDQPAWVPAEALTVLAPESGEPR